MDIVLKINEGPVTLDELVAGFKSRREGSHQLIEDEAFGRILRGYSSILTNELVSEFTQRNRGK